MTFEFISVLIDTQTMECFHSSHISASFKKLICSWIGSVHESAILHPKSINGKFQIFSNSDCFDALHESGEEEEEATTSTSHRSITYYIDREYDCA